MTKRIPLAAESKSNLIIFFRVQISRITQLKMATPNRTIKLQSNEGDIFDVDITSLQQSELLMVFSPSKKNKLVECVCSYFD
jgi:hypothetical protein